MRKATLICPRCGINLEYMAETENTSDGLKRITYFYRCPRCGYRVDDEVLLLEHNANSLKIRVVKRRLKYEKVLLGLKPLMEIRLR